MYSLSSIRRRYEQENKKSAVISIAVIAVLLLAILIGVKNGTLDKLTKEMPTLATSQTETEKSAENESEKMKAVATLLG